MKRSIRGLACTAIALAAFAAPSTAGADQLGGFTPHPDNGFCTPNTQVAILVTKSCSFLSDAGAGGHISGTATVESRLGGAAPSPAGAFSEPSLTLVHTLAAPAKKVTYAVRYHLANASASVTSTVFHRAYSTSELDVIMSSENCANASCFSYNGYDFSDTALGLGNKSDEDGTLTIELGGGEDIPAGPIDIAFQAYVGANLNGDRGTASSELDVTILDVSAVVTPA